MSKQKEMIEQIEHIRGILGLVGDQDTVNMASDLHESVEKQAERVKELEQQNKRYEETLKFYADERNYRERDFGIIKQTAIQEGDKGNTAREALE